MKNLIDHNFLREILHYDEDTGIFTWAKDRWRCKAGSVAGTVDSNGYISIKIKQRKYRAHRLAVLYMIGKWPKEQVDHKNNEVGDNRWCNLRECNQSQNNANSKRNGISGYKGVSKSRNKWRSRIYVNGQEKILGYFDCKHKAAIAYNHAAQVFFGEFACLNEITTGATV